MRWTTALATAALGLGPTGAAAWGLGQFEHVVVFGDSYTDSGRGMALIKGKGKLAPGVAVPDSAINADGGRTWPQYVAQYTRGAVNVTNYAISGAVCSNDITPRPFLPAVPGLEQFPSVREDEMPAFFADLKAATGEPNLLPALTSKNTVYAIFIGTNDVGEGAFLTDSQVPGKSLVDYMDCVWAQVARLYDAGGRYFVLFNLASLYTAPLYARADRHGVKTGSYWPDKPANTTAVSEKMRQYVATLNSLYEYRTAYEATAGTRLKGAQIALYQTEQLFLDIYNHPERFLNGTQKPYNTSDWETNHGSFASPDSYMWFDELHPSEQTERHIALEFVRVLNGTSKYGCYFGKTPGHY